MIRVHFDLEHPVVAGNIRRLAGIAVILLAGCTAEPPALEDLQNRNGVVFEVGAADPYTGQVRSLYPDGKVSFDGLYRDGLRDGVVTRWHPNGQKSAEGLFRLGVAEGIHTEWHSNGFPSRKTAFLDGKQDGTETTWNVQGEIEAEVTYRLGVPMSEPGEDIYNRHCFACHAAGIAGAPKLGDVQAWASRIEKGEEALLAATIAGKPPASPPAGLCATCTEQELRDAIAYIVKRSSGP